MWAFLGLASIITAILNIEKWMRGQEEKFFRFASFSLTALTMCAFYSDGAGRVTAEDWGLNGYYAKHVRCFVGLRRRLDIDQRDHAFSESEAGAE